MTSKSRTPVTFLNSAGEIISNDPFYLAQQTLSKAGVEGKAPDFDVPGPYDKLTGDELKALAKEREISTKGFKKASQYRDALEEWDEAQENPDSDDDDSDESDSKGDSKAE